MRKKEIIDCLKAHREIIEELERKVYLLKRDKEFLIEKIENHLSIAYEIHNSAWGLFVDPIIICEDCGTQEGGYVKEKKYLFIQEFSFNEDEDVVFVNYNSMDGRHYHSKSINARPKPKEEKK